MVQITDKNKCCICEREIPLEEKQDTEVSHNALQGDSREGRYLHSNYYGRYFHSVCYSSLDRWDLTEKARSLLSAPDTPPLQTID